MATVGTGLPASSTTAAVWLTAQRDRQSLSTRSRGGGRRRARHRFRSTRRLSGVSPRAGRATKTLAGDAIFDDVSFAYTSTPVLKHREPARQPRPDRGAGGTDAGKTTIVNLLTRFLRRGQRAHPGRHLALTSARWIATRCAASLASCYRIPYLFTGTVLENIRYGRLDASDEEAHAAAAGYNAEQFIHRLPTAMPRCSGRANNLSQGQRQLPAIARAILADPRILILDRRRAAWIRADGLQIQEAMLLADGGAHQLRHRAPAEHHPQRRPRSWC